MRVFVRVAICLALTCLTGFSPPLAAEPVNLHEQQRIAVPEPYSRALDLCLYGDDLLVLTGRSEVEQGVDEWELIHIKKQADASGGSSGK